MVVLAGRLAAVLAGRLAAAVVVVVAVLPGLATVPAPAGRAGPGGSGQ